MAAVQVFTDPGSAAVSEASRTLQRLLLGAGPAQPLRAAAEQGPSWVRGQAGQGRLKDALAHLQDITNKPGKLLPICVSQIEHRVLASAALSAAQRGLKASATDQPG